MACNAKAPLPRADSLIASPPTIRTEVDDRQRFGWPATFEATEDGARFLVTDLVVRYTLDPQIAIVKNRSASFE